MKINNFINKIQQQQQQKINKRETCIKSMPSSSIKVNEHEGWQRKTVLQNYNNTSANLTTE
jgi:hypothetical protein